MQLPICKSCLCPPPACSVGNSLTHPVGNMLSSAPSEHLSWGFVNFVNILQLGQLQMANVNYFCRGFLGWYLFLPQALVFGNWVVILSLGVRRQCCIWLSGPKKTSWGQRKWYISEKCDSLDSIRRGLGPATRLLRRWSPKSSLILMLLLLEASNLKVRYAPYLDLMISHLHSGEDLLVVRLAISHPCLHLKTTLLIFFLFKTNIYL